MFNQQPRIRANVTVEDRRAVYVMAMGRKPADVAKVPHEQFLRNALKDRLNWPRREPAPEAVKTAVRDLAAQLIQRDKQRAEALVTLAISAPQAV